MNLKEEFEILMVFIGFIVIGMVLAILLAR
jgi:flagellar biosynthesis protein FliP